MTHSYGYMIEQKNSTKALIAFCRQRKVNHPNEIERCLQALNDDDPVAAFEFYKTVRLEGMGSLTDSWPSTLEGEDPCYSLTLLQALACYWHSQMKLLG
jgi:hypothetical protein